MILMKTPQGDEIEVELRPFDITQSKDFPASVYLILDVTEDNVVCVSNLLSKSDWIKTVFTGDTYLGNIECAVRDMLDTMSREVK